MCHYYKSYKGPKLINANLDNKDVTESINGLYGKECNWTNKLHEASSIFGSNDITKTLFMQFETINPDYPEYTYILIESLNTVINPPIAMPESLQYVCMNSINLGK